MKTYKTNKSLEINVDGFNASHQYECKLSLVEIFPEKTIKKPDEDVLHLVTSTIDLYTKEERSSYITLNKQQLKEMKTYIEELLKK